MDTDDQTPGEDQGHQRYPLRKSGKVMMFPKSLTKRERETLIASKLSSPILLTNDGKVRIEAIGGILRGERWQVNPQKAEEMIKSGFWMPI